jgi:hypothetical protein
VPQYEYMKVSLNTVGPKLADIDLLNELGLAGWRLVVITANSMAYLIRDIPAPADRVPTRRARRPGPPPAS